MNDIPVVGTANRQVPEESASSPGPGSAAVARNALHLVLGQATLTLLSFVLSGALGRALGPADFGLYFLVVSTSNFVLTVVDWGQTHVLVREIARRRHEARWLLGGALVIRAAGTALAAACTIGVMPLLGYDSRVVTLTSAYLLATLPLALWTAYGMAFRAIERMDADAKVSVVNKVLGLAFILPALALGGRLLSVLVGLGAAASGALAYAIGLAKRTGIPPPALRASAVRELLTIGLPFVVTNVLTIGQAYIEPLVVSLVAPEQVLGWFGAARTIATALLMPAVIVVGASFPRIARASAIPEEFEREVRTAVRPVVLLAVLVGAGTYAFAPLGISVVYGSEKYQGAVAVLRAFAPVLALMSINVALSTAALVAGRAKIIAAFKIASLAFTAGLGYWWLVPLAQRAHGNGAVGIVAASGTTELLMLVVFARLAPRRTVTTESLLDLARAAAVGALALLATTLLARFHPAIQLATFLIVFAAAVPASGLFSLNEIIRLGRGALRRDPASPGPESG